MDTLPDTPGFVGEVELAETLGIHVNTLRSMRRDGTGPKAYRLSTARVGYLWSDVKGWLSTRLIARAPAGDVTAASNLPPDRQRARRHAAVTSASNLVPGMA